MLYRDSWVEVDLTAYKENIATLRKLSNKKTIAIIKANGYGNGDGTVARSAIEAGAELLAVSSLDEALTLRNENINQDILVLGYVNPNYISICIENNITTTVVSMDWIKKLIEQNCAGAKVHFKVDTGMNRIGIKDINEIKEGLSLLREHQVQIDGIFTHFACSDDPSDKMTDEQMRKFKNVLNEVGKDFTWIHTSNSDATIHYPEEISNSTRCGIAMYGISSYETDLKPVMSLKSKVICVKQILKGETVGYGATYTAENDEWIATIPIGYADGWIRKNQGRVAFIHGVACEFVGRICMDQCMLRVPPSTQVGDVVELIGAHMPITQVAEELDTIPYEVMTGLTDRLGKVYIEDGKTIRTINPRFDRHSNQ